MKFFYSKNIRCIIAILISLTITITNLIPSYAEDSVEDLESTTSNLENELSNLDQESNALSAELDSLLTQLNSIASDIEQTKDELAIAKGNAEAQYESMKVRIRYMYENGSINFWEILFSATSIADFLSRAEYVALINRHDRKIYEELEATRVEIAEKENNLLQKQNELFALKDELASKEAQLNKEISIASSELVQYKDKLEKAKEAALKAEESAKEEVVPIIPEPEEPPAPPTSDDKPDYSDNEMGRPGNSENADSNPPIVNPTVGDVELLAALIECEAGSRDYEGMLAVGSVVVNRMKSRHYPDTLRGVIYQTGQFSPVRSGKLDRVLERGVKDSCVQAAQDALNGKNNVGNCLSFRSSDSGHAGIIIGDNVFF